MALLLLLGQFCTVRAFRTAPVGAVAPFQYAELIWAALIGYAFWSEVPAANVWIGAVDRRRQRPLRHLARTQASRGRSGKPRRSGSGTGAPPRDSQSDREEQRYEPEGAAVSRHRPEHAQALGRRSTLLAAPSTIGLPQAQYFTTQASTAVWALLPASSSSARCVACLALTVAARTATARSCRAPGFVLIAATLVSLLHVDHRRQSATSNRTSSPANCSILRGMDCTP